MTSVLNVTASDETAPFYDAVVAELGNPSRLPKETLTPAQRRRMSKKAKKITAMVERKIADGAKDVHP